MLLLSLALFTASMLTLREGLRFRSRPLRYAERQIVERALLLWAQVEGQPACLLEPYRKGQIRAMDHSCFSRAEERCTFGYTDERGRVLLNPHLCFSYLECMPPGPIHTPDLVVTLATLYHEGRHHSCKASEEQARRDEMQFVERAQRWASGRGLAELADELAAFSEKFQSARISSR